MVKVAEYTDTTGMKPVAAKYIRNRNQDIEKNKTYVITTLLDEPYMMLRQQDIGKVLEGNDKYEGYCKDLADLIAKRLDINCKMKNDPEASYLTLSGENLITPSSTISSSFSSPFSHSSSPFFTSVRNKLMLVIEYLICFFFLLSLTL